MTLREAALAYLELGLRPIPCEPGGKRAIVKWKDFETRAPRREEVEHWWAMWPDANIALVLGNGLLAVDLDSFDARENLERAGVVLPADAPVVATGKGAHVYLSGTSGDRVGLVPGVDIRGVGYVVGPPSIHPSGRQYVWVNEFKTPPPAPQSLLNLLQAATNKSPVTNSGDWVAEALAGVAEGGRDQTCTRLAGHLLGKGVSVQASEAILLAWAERCTPPFPADQVAKCVASIAKRAAFDAPGSLPPSAADLVDATLALITSPVRNVRSTGLPRLDERLEGGFEAGTLTLLGALPGVGKTCLMLQIATNVALSGKGVLFVTLEMGATRLLRRVLSQMSLVRFANLKSGSLVDGERLALNIAANKLRELPLWIETRVRTVEAVDAVLGEYDPDRIGLVCVDYAQKMSSPHGGDDRRHEVEHVSEMLTKLCVSRDLPVLAASALSRPENQRPNWRPTIHNLRESAKLGHDADTVILLHRDGGGPATEVDVAKQRDGATGGMVLFFKGETLRFEETAA
jgi:hypothetical protein